MWAYPVSEILTDIGHSNLVTGKRVSRNFGDFAYKDLLLFNFLLSRWLVVVNLQMTSALVDPFNCTSNTVLSTKIQTLLLLARER